MQTEDDTNAPRGPYPSVTLLRRSEYVLAEIFFEPNAVHKADLLFGNSRIYLDGSVSLSQTDGGSELPFQRDIVFPDDLLLSDPRAVLRGDALTIRLSVRGYRNILPGPSTMVLRPVPIVTLNV